MIITMVLWWLLCLWYSLQVETLGKSSISGQGIFDVLCCGCFLVKFANAEVSDQHDFDSWLETQFLQLWQRSAVKCIQTTEISPIMRSAHASWEQHGRLLYLWLGSQPESLSMELAFTAPTVWERCLVMFKLVTSSNYKFRSQKFWGMLPLCILA